MSVLKPQIGSKFSSLSSYFFQKISSFSPYLRAWPFFKPPPPICGPSGCTPIPKWKLSTPPPPGFGPLAACWPEKQQKREIREWGDETVRMRAHVHFNQRFGGGGPVKLDSMWQHRLTRPLHVQHTYYRIIYKQNPFKIISRGIQRWTSTDFRLK